MITIFCNELKKGWNPKERDHLGGSEESLYCLAESLDNVEVYANGDFDSMTINGVIYKNKELFNPKEKFDVLISFKAPELWGLPVNARKKIHWSVSIEQAWDTSAIDEFVNISEFHRARNWLAKGVTIPLGIKGLYKPLEKEKDSFLYCSSPDRGLEQLLYDWPRIYGHNQNRKLYITYGFDYFEGSPFKDHIFNMIDSLENVEYLGNVSSEEMSKLYGKIETWIHPLNFAEGELFCLNALKARLSGMESIVNRIGGLRDTVGDHKDYIDFINNNEVEEIKTDGIKPETWAEVAEHWKKLF